MCEFEMSIFIFKGFYKQKYFYKLIINQYDVGYI